MLRERACGRGLVAAALLTLEPATVGALAAAAMLAPDGRCKALDAAADGCRLRDFIAMCLNRGCCCTYSAPCSDHYFPAC